jgi:branched-chain amino acid transport system permease protein
MNDRPPKIFILHIVVLVCACFMPVILSKYYLMITIEAVIFAVFAMSLDLIMGYAGIVSFGHAAFFGLGGYALGMTIMKFIPSIWAGFIVAAFLAATMSFFIGLVSIRTRGIYFAILTLLFGELIYRIVFNTPALGGSDGLVGLPVPELSFLFFKIDMSNITNFYFITILFAYFSYLVSWIIVNSPFGKVLKALKDNENRVPFLGFNTKYYRITAFVISGVLAGFSGAFFSLFKTFSDVSQLHFLLSGKVIIMVLLGGMGTLIGPMVGAIFLTIYETLASSWFESYHLLTGAIFIIVVIFMPKGILGLFTGLKKRGGK